MIEDPKFRALEQENKALKKQLAETENKLALYRLMRIMIDHVPDLIWAKDMEERHIIVNQACCEKIFLCDSPEKVEGKTHSYFAELERNKGYEYTFAESCNNSDKRIKQKQQPQRFLEDGSVRGNYLALDVHKAPVYDDNGNMIGIVGCGRDVTLELQNRREKEDLQAQLRQSQKMEALGTLAGGIAHDLNNILQSISAAAESLLLNSTPDSSFHNELEIISNSAFNGGDLIKQLLLFSRKANTNRQCMSFNREIKNSLTILERTLPKMINIEKELEEGLSPINADPVQIQQIILNIGTNAVHGMPDGGCLRIKTSKETIKKEVPNLTIGNYIRLSITDNGVGMEEEVSKRIFDPFFTTKERGKGTGLGLASVYGIVRDHGGSITCSSAPGKGTRFDILFPALEQESSQAYYDHESKNGVSEKDGSETILVVDDEEMIRQLVSTFLTQTGYKVIEAENGEAALDKYSIEAADLVILDLSMPGMGGEKCMEQLLKMDPKAKILLASGYFHGNVSTQIDNGKYRQHFIQKPYRLKALAQKVRQFLDE